MAPFLACILLLQVGTHQAFRPTGEAPVPAQDTALLKRDIQQYITTAPATSKMIVPMRSVPSAVISGAQGWVDRVLRKNILAPKLALDAFGLRSSLHPDLIVARYAGNGVITEIVESGINFVMLIRDPAMALDTSNPDALITTVRDQIGKYCNIERSELAAAKAHHGFLPDKRTYAGQFAVATDGVTESRIAWWNRPRFVILGEVLMLSFDERLGNEPEDRGAAGHDPRVGSLSPGRFGIIGRN